MLTDLDNLKMNDFFDIVEQALDVYGMAEVDEELIARLGQGEICV